MDDEIIQNVTTTGQRILRELVARLESLGVPVISQETEGLSEIELPERPYVMITLGTDK